MKISYSWLKEFIDITASPEELSKLLTSTGLEVEALEAIESVKGGLKGFVIGEVLSCEPFEVKGKKLNLTTCHIGTDTPSSIVCGAANVAAGQRVVVATLGTTIYLPDGGSFEIASRKVYGHLSEGMICAEDELGLGIGHEGIMVLDTDVPNGTPAAAYFKLSSDTIIEIGLTPNRIDAAGHLGVARDIKAKTNRQITMPKSLVIDPSAQPSAFQIEIEEPDRCPRFCGLEIQNVKVGPSPEWLKNKLTAIGIGSINNIVDITNYICHGLGQPMHAFDADQILGQKIMVKCQPEGTVFTTLDGKERILKASDLTVSNAQSPMAIAGVFGGINSGIKETTKHVFLEVAYFEPSGIRKTASHHGLKTDASFRYERGTDPFMPPQAILIAAQMVLDLAGGQVIGQVIDANVAAIPTLIVDLSYQQVDRLIGKKIAHQQMKDILISLDFEIISETDQDLKLKVPAYRVDVTRPADVIEEILRIYGFESVEAAQTLRADFLSDFPEHDASSLQFKTSQTLAGKGYNEIMNLSISNSKLNAFIGTEPVKLLNPLSEDLNEMRVSLLFPGLQSLAYNINRKQDSLKMFEFGRTYFSKGPGKHKETQMLGLWLTGALSSENWQEKSPKVGFFDIKNAAEICLKAMKANFEYKESSEKTLAYGLDIYAKSKKIGFVGAVTAAALKMADLKQAVFYAELDWGYLLKNYSNSFTFQEISRFPQVRRDLSLVLDQSVAFESVQQIGLKADMIKQVSIFDIFRGSAIGEDKKAYSVSFTLENKEKTLEEAEIEATMKKLIKTYEKELGALFRS